MPVSFYGDRSEKKFAVCREEVENKLRKVENKLSKDGNKFRKIKK
jgi:hypothetical protein